MHPGMWVRNYLLERKGSWCWNWATTVTSCIHQLPAVRQADDTLQKGLLPHIIDAVVTGQHPIRQQRC